MFIAFANNSPVSLDRAGVPTIPFDSGVRPPRSKSRTTSVRVSSVGIRLRKRSVARIRIIEPLKLTNPVLGQPRQQVEQDRKRDPGGIAVHLVLIEPNVLKTGLHPLDEIHPFCSRERIPQGLPRLPISGRCQRLVDDRGFE